jgi:hypothetical protein
MIVHFVGAGPGDQALLTRKAERLLGTCRICIYAGSLVSPGVLALIPNEAEKHDSAGMSLDKFWVHPVNGIDLLGICIMSPYFPPGRSSILAWISTAPGRSAWRR